LHKCADGIGSLGNRGDRLGLRRRFFLGMEELDLPDELVAGVASQKEQEGVEQAAHGDKVLAVNAIREGAAMFLYSAGTRRIADWSFSGARARRERTWQIEI